MNNVIPILLMNFKNSFSMCYGVFTPEPDNDKTNVEPVHSYEAFHTRPDKPGVKGIIGMHRFNICLFVVWLWCEHTITVKVYILLIMATN